MILFLPNLTINVTIMILKLSFPIFQIARFLALHPMEFIFLNSFDSLEHLVMLQTSKFKRIVGKPNFSDQFINEWDTT